MKMTRDEERQLRLKCIEIAERFITRNQASPSANIISEAQLLYKYITTGNIKEGAE